MKYVGPNGDELPRGKKVCPQCEGSGGYHRISFNPPVNDGTADDSAEWVPCRKCKGKGYV